MAYLCLPCDLISSLGDCIKTTGIFTFSAFGACLFIYFSYMDISFYGKIIGAGILNNTFTAACAFIADVWRNILIGFHIINCIKGARI